MRPLKARQAFSETCESPPQLCILVRDILKGAWICLVLWFFVQRPAITECPSVKPPPPPSAAVIAPVSEPRTTRDPGHDPLATAATGRRLQKKTFSIH